MLHLESRYLVRPSTTFGFDANPIDFSSTSAVGSLVPLRGEKQSIRLSRSELWSTIWRFFINTVNITVKHHFTLKRQIRHMADRHENVVLRLRQQVGYLLGQVLVHRRRQLVDWHIRLDEQHRHSGGGSSSVEQTNLKSLKANLRTIENCQRWTTEEMKTDEQIDNDQLQGETAHAPYP